MNRAYDTLFYPLSAAGLTPPAKDHTVLFINAAPCSGMDLLKPSDFTLQQHFKPYESALRAQGYEVAPDFPAGAALFDYVFIAAPKNKLEIQYFLARGLKLLREGGTLVCAAANDAGGNRLAGFFQVLGIGDFQQQSKHKARVVWVQKPKNYNSEKIEEWIAAGAPQEILDGQFLSYPGLFSWDKADKASEILARNLPGNMSGHGADFGCGYGYLSGYLLQHNPAIASLACIDADFRAVSACRKNMERPDNPALKKYYWEDLTKPVSALCDLDWIVMNPPFHEGKSSDIGIGQSFIKTAAKSLRPGGMLWMVANAGLPYEKILESEFKSCSKKFEGCGYKVYSAAK